MTEKDCIFCRIAAGDLPAAILRQDDDTVAFRDLDPQAPEHVLVIPRRHVRSVGTLGPDDVELAGKVLLAARTVAEEVGIADSGFRLVINNGTDAMQSVDHLHVHVIGGRKLRWPPG